MRKGLLIVLLFVTSCSEKKEYTDNIDWDKVRREEKKDDSLRQAAIISDTMQVMPPKGFPFPYMRRVTTGDKYFVSVDGTHYMQMDKDAIIKFKREHLYP